MVDQKIGKGKVSNQHKLINHLCIVKINVMLLRVQHRII